MRINLPVIAETDILVVGTSVPAVQAAVALKKQGFEVFCITSRTYCGEDIAAPFDYWSEAVATALGVETPCPPTPMTFKRHWEQELIAADIPFLYQTFPVRAGVDRRGNFAGMAVVNRSGFQAIAARAVIDGTFDMTAARLMGGEFAPFKPGTYPVSRVVIGAPAPAKNGLSCQPLPTPVRSGEKSYPAFRVTQNFAFKTGDFFERSKVEVALRRLAWTPEQVWSADSCDFSALRPVILTAPSAAFPVVEPAQPQAVELAAQLAESSRARQLDHFPGERGDYSAEAVAFGTLSRYSSCPKVGMELNALPLTGRYDVVVAGGGAGGAPAAIAGARESARVLCVEATSQLGGLATSGRIGHYDGGESYGFSREIDQRVADLGGAPEPDHERWNIEWKQHFFLTATAMGGVTVWFNSLVVGALRHGNLVTGTLVATPGGVVAVESSSVIDGTGNAEVAQRAGAETAFSDSLEPACQGAGVAPAEPDVFVAHTDYMFIADSDQQDLTRAFAAGRALFQDRFDLAQVAGTRERRRVLGDLVLTPEDFLAGRTYSDTITVARGNFQTRGYTVHPLFGIFEPGDRIWTIHIPLRALLPRTLDGILVIGPGLSAHRDALPMLRRISDRQNLGFAAGLAGAMAAKRNLTVRKVDVRELQRLLGAVGILPASIMTEIDGIPRVTTSEQKLAQMFREPVLSALALRQQFAAAPTPELAEKLALLGDSTGRKVLISAIERCDWDQGWRYRGLGQSGADLSPLDAKLMALSHISSPENLSVVMHKLEQLTCDMPFSHFRAIAVNLFQLQHASAVPYLEALLCAPGMRGHLYYGMRETVEAVQNAVDDNAERNAQLKEIYLLKSLVACDPTERYALNELNRCVEQGQFLFADFAAK